MSTIELIRRVPDGSHALVVRASRRSRARRCVALAVRRDALDVILRCYLAANPSLFGSVARGDATRDSDIDLLVDLLPGGGNELLRVAGIAEELSELLGRRVDVVAASLLREEVSAAALRDAIAGEIRGCDRWTAKRRRA